MLAERFENAAGFLASAERHLLEAEVENSLVLGVAREVARRGSSSQPPPYFACVREGRDILLCAFRTLPYKLGLTRSRSEAAIPLLAADVHAAALDVHEVFGPEPTVSEFAEDLAGLSGSRTRCHKRQRMYVLREVTPIEGVARGRLRPAQERDLETLQRWTAQFLVELGDKGDAEEMSRERVRDGKLFLWEDEEPVSMAAWAGKTESGVRISHVYTPRERRGRGYATACVASLTRLMLDRGNRYCCLYTDLSNPTSNAIYQKIGYRPVGDSALYRIERPASSNP